MSGGKLFVIYFLFTFLFPFDRLLFVVHINIGAIGMAITPNWRSINRAQLQHYSTTVTERRSLMVT